MASSGGGRRRPAAALFAWWLTTTSAFIGWAGSLPINESLRLVIERSGGAEIYLPWQMIFYLVVGTLVGIVVSLLTRPVDEAQLDRYYALVRTPVKTGEPAPEEPCMIPAGIEVPPKHNVFADSSIEVMVPDKSSVYGFVASWALVGAMIYFFFAVTR